MTKSKLEQDKLLVEKKARQAAKASGVAMNQPVNKKKSSVTKEE